jgi:hypothetical protein
MMKRITLLLVFISLLPSLVFTPFANAEGFWTVRDTLAIPTEKQETFGIGVAFLDLQQASVVITIREINEKSLADSIDNPEKLRFSVSKKGAIKLDLSGRTNMVSINLPEGLYQITQVDVPHFDLPYKINTNNQDVWRFRVHRNKINYIGTMKVSPIRSKNTVDTVWLNQFATHLVALQTIVADADIGLPIVHGAGYRDPFFAILEGAINE